MSGVVFYVSKVIDTLTAQVAQSAKQPITLSKNNSMKPEKTLQWSVFQNNESQVVQLKGELNSCHVVSIMGATCFFFTHQR